MFAIDCIANIAKLYKKLNYQQSPVMGVQHTSITHHMIQIRQNQKWHPTSHLFWNLMTNPFCHILTASLCCHFQLSRRLTSPASPGIDHPVLPPWILISPSPSAKFNTFHPNHQAHLQPLWKQGANKN